MYEYLEKKRLLEKPSEQERLLSEIPKVIADKLEPEVMPDALERVEEGNSSPELKHKHISDINGTDGSGEYSVQFILIEASLFCLRFFSHLLKQGILYLIQLF